ncbi:alpha/beta hydrolase [Streptomyces sp. 11-1-2]|uniref:alpha/beta fold hydrolase n=1 Tax=unclassified Streptomyces TaxID=2593676 RepID=UPI000B8D68BD|nr:alpha/beta hydrolase [Streptomyces sp. 11-1-2]ASQ99249.1 alpha/beta hydrolase [Streptomyces sp. 11-1-2]
MQHASFGPEGAHIGWTGTAGAGDGGPPRVYVHGLGASSAVYHAHIAAVPALAGRRSLFVDLPGHGISDRPADFGYTLEDHADALAAALDAAGVRGAKLIGHSMGGSVAIVLAVRRPELVSRLVLTEANLDPDPPLTAGSSRISTYTEDAFVRGGGFEETLERIGPVWRATMRLADPTALHRSACALARGTRPTMREMLLGLEIPRMYLVGGNGEELTGREELTAAGVTVRTVPGAGHNVMFDNAPGFAAAIGDQP